MQKKVPPQSLELEKSLLGALLQEKNGMDRVAERLSPSNFYATGHALIYGAMIDLFEKNEPLDFHTVLNELKMSGGLEKAGGAEYLKELLEGVVSAADLERFASDLKDKHIARELIATATGLVENCYQESEDVDTMLDQAETKIFNISQDRLKQDVIQVKELLPKTFEEIAKYSKEGVFGVPTDYRELDEMLSGFQKSDLIIIAARPSMRKSALALPISANMAIKNRIPVGFFSLEMSSQQLIQRILCSEARINMHSLRSGKLPHRDYPRLSLAAGPLAEAPLFIDDTPALSILELRAKARRLKAKHKIGAIFVDYLQLMRGLRTDSRELEISSISQSLKALAKELDIPVIALSQLNRKVEDRPDARPHLADLRESGAIEQDSDVVMFIYREEVYKPETAEPGKVDIIIGKQRNGPVGTINMRFIREYARFENYAARALEEPQVSF
jgi:replicative DNA helicase